MFIWQQQVLGASLWNKLIAPQLTAEPPASQEDPAGSSQDGGLGISRPFAVVTKVGVAVISNSNRNSVSGNLLANFSGSVDH